MELVLSSSAPAVAWSVDVVAVVFDVLLLTGCDCAGGDDVPLTCALGRSCDSSVGGGRAMGTNDLIKLASTSEGCRSPSDS